MYWEHLNFSFLFWSVSQIAVDCSCPILLWSTRTNFSCVTVFWHPYSSSLSLHPHPATCPSPLFHSLLWGFFFKLPQMSENVRCLSFCAWCLSVNMTSFSSIPNWWNWQHFILFMQIIFHSISFICSSINGHFARFQSWLLCLCCNKCGNEIVSSTDFISFGYISRVGLLDHLVVNNIIILTDPDKSFGWDSIFLCDENP